MYRDLREGLDMLYKVKKGDTLANLAKYFMGDVNDWEFLAAVNGDVDPHNLEVGQVLEIPVPIELTLTAERIKPLCMNISDEERQELVEILNFELPRWGVDEPLEVAHFLAQCAHESGGFRLKTENLNYSAKALSAVFGSRFEGVAEQYHRQPERIANRAYGNRMGNGDEASGDGWRYRGGGYGQLTGHDNYKACGEDMGVDLLADPDLVRENDRMALFSIIWYWNKYNIGDKALADDLEGITRAINGRAMHGLAARANKLQIAKEILNIV